LNPTTSILEGEIREQPEAIRRLLVTEREHAARLARDLRDSFEYILIAARGSSDNAARYAQYLFGAHNQLPVALATPSLFTLYRQPPRVKGALVIGISQSGQSPDIVEVIAEGRRQGRPTLAITNDDASPLAQAADQVLNLHAGPERAVAATKTYTTSLAALAMLSCAFSQDASRQEELSAVPEQMQKALDSATRRMGRAERYRYMGQCAVIGRGYNYSTAFEVALKVKELTRIVAEPYSSADFRHGPIAMVQEGFPVIVIAPSGPVFGDAVDLIADLRRRGGELLVISGDPGLLEQAHLPLPIPERLPEWLSPLAAVIPGQLFGLALAQARGLDPDQPSGILKVTETL
jgi:glutamine---fructose-6-phosphate transaminase (isomerizing)